MNSALAGQNGAYVEGVMQEDRTVHLVTANPNISITTAYHIIQGGEKESKQLSAKQKALQMGLQLTLLQNYSNVTSSFVPFILAMKTDSSPGHCI
jgi:hypothetical protein